MYCYGIGIICCTANRDLVVLRSAVLGGGEGGGGASCGRLLIPRLILNTVQSTLSYKPWGTQARRQSTKQPKAKVEKYFTGPVQTGGVSLLRVRASARSVGRREGVRTSRRFLVVSRRGIYQGAYYSFLSRLASK